MASSFGQELVDQLVQLHKIRRPHEPLDDFAPFVQQERGGGELNVPPLTRHGPGVVDGHFEGQLTRLRKIDHITGRVVTHGNSQCFIAPVFELVVRRDEFGHFSHTGGAAGGPEIYQGYFSLQLGRGDGGAIQQNKGRFGCSLGRTTPKGQDQADRACPIHHTMAYRL